MKKNIDEVREGLELAKHGGKGIWTAQDVINLFGDIISGFDLGTGNISKEIRTMVSYINVSRASDVGRMIYAQSIMFRAFNYMNRFLKDYKIEKEIDFDGEPLIMTVKVWFRKPKRQKRIIEEGIYTEESMARV